MKITLIRSSLVPARKQAAAGEVGETRTYEWNGGNTQLWLNKADGFSSWNHYQTLMTKLEDWDAREDWGETADRRVVFELDTDRKARDEAAENGWGYVAPYTFEMEVGTREMPTWGNLKLFIYKAIRNEVYAWQKIRDYEAERRKAERELRKDVIYLIERM